MPATIKVIKKVIKKVKEEPKSEVKAEIPAPYKLSKISPYYNRPKYAVVRKLKEDSRFYCNFKVLYKTIEEAEAEAYRLSIEHKKTFYVIKIVGITNRVVDNDSGQDI